MLDQHNQKKTHRQFQFLFCQKQLSQSTCTDVCKSKMKYFTLWGNIVKCQRLRLDLHLWQRTNYRCKYCWSDTFQWQTVVYRSDVTMTTTSPCPRPSKDRPNRLGEVITLPCIFQLTQPGVGLISCVKTHQSMHIIQWWQSSRQQTESL